MVNKFQTSSLKELLKLKVFVLTQSRHAFSACVFTTCSIHCWRYSRSSFVSLAIVGASEVCARAGACGPGGAWHALTGCVGLHCISRQLRYSTSDNMMSVRRSQDVWDCQLTIPVHLIPYRISVSAYHHRTVVRYGTVVLWYALYRNFSRCDLNFGPAVRF